MDPNPSLRLGFIAEQVNTLTPELVAKDKDGLPESVDYAKLTPILTKAIQELDAKINTLNLSGGSAIPSSLTLKNLSSSLGTWSIDEEGTLMAVKVITDEIITNKLTIGSSQQPSGITVYDKETFAPVCIESKNYVLTATPGQCGAQSLPVPQSPISASSSPVSLPSTAPILSETASSSSDVLATTSSATSFPDVTNF